MPYPARSRLAGLLLALSLNVGFIAMFVWQVRPRLDHVPDPTRMALVWAVPVVEAPPPAPPAPAAPSKPARQREARRIQAAIAPVAVIEEAPTMRADELVIESDSADPFEASDSATVNSFDKAVTGKAIKMAMDERKALEDTQKFVKSGPAKTKYEVFADNAEHATIPFCYRADAMKHTPPVLKVGKLKIPLGGVLAAPFFVKAIASGKCRMK
ncbi:MAG TPA: hypothetical protein VGD30_18965 [Telluria sp.]